MLLRATFLPALLVALALAAAPATATVLSPDTAFNGTGVLAGRGNAGVVATPDGGVWIATYSAFIAGDLAIERRKSDGTLDPSWGLAGTVTFSNVQRPKVRGFDTLDPAIIPNAGGGLDVAYTVPDLLTPQMYVKRLTSTGAQDTDFLCPVCIAFWPSTSLFVPDGDGLALASDGMTSARITRIGPDGLARAGSPQTITELPSPLTAGLTRLADGTLVVATGDLAGDKVVKLAARTAAGAMVPAYGSAAALAVAPYAGLKATTGGRIVAGGDSANAAVLEGRDGATGATDPTFGTAGLVTLPTLGTMPIQHRVTAMAPFGDGLVVNTLEAGLVAGKPVLAHLLTVTKADGTLLAGPRTIGSYPTYPTFPGLPAAVTPDLKRIYVVRSDADAPYVSDVVALKVADDTPPPPPVVPPATTTTTPTVPTVPTVPTTPTTPSIPTTPVTPTPPAVRVTVTKLAAAKGGTVKLTVRAGAAGDLVLTAAAKAGRTTLRWGPVAATFRTAGTKTVTLRPSAAVRKALAKRGAKLRATLTLRFVPASGARVQLTRTTTLRGTR